MFDKQELSRLHAEFRSWAARNAEAFKRERKPESEFVDDYGVPVQRVYTPLDLAERGFNYSDDLGLPGEYPFTRSTTSTQYREQPWLIEQYAGHEMPEACNKYWKAIIEAGGVPCMAADLPTQLGLDPDHRLSEGEVGRVGVSMASLRDWEIALDGIDLGKVYFSVNLNATAIIAIASQFIVAEQQGVDLRRLRGQCQNDILKEHAVRGNFVFPIEHGARLVVDSWSYCARHAPSYDVSTISSVHYGNSGGTRVHAAAFGLAGALSYFQEVVNRGLDIDLIAPHVMFIINSEHFGFFQWIAQLRALRKVYARQMRERFKPKNAESLMTRWWAIQGGTALTRQHYLVNIARSGIACLGAALAGSATINLTRYGEQFGIPGQDETMTAVAIQQMVAHETGVADTIDPLAGSYFVESLTLDFEEQIVKELTTIDNLGGIVKCINDGYVQRVIANDYYDWYNRYRSGKVIRVGGNFAVPSAEHRPPKVYRANPAFEDERKAAVREVRKKRDNHKVRHALDEVKATAALPPTEDNNLMPPIMEAVKAYATAGEITSALKEVWGEGREPSVL